MANFNKVILLGNLTRDPELKHANSGTPICSFGIAVNSGSKDREEVLFIDCAAFNRTAELATEYLRKGTPALIEGRLQLQQWEREGEKRSKHVVLVDRVQFLGGKGETSPRPLSDDDIPF